MKDKSDIVLGEFRNLRKSIKSKRTKRNICRRFLRCPENAPRSGSGFGLG